MARAKNIGTMYAELSVKDKMSVGLKHAQKNLVAFNKSAGVALGGAVRNAAALGAIASGAMAAGLAAGTMRALQLGASLDDLSKQTGLAASDALKLSKAYQLGGVESSKMGADVAKMQKAIVSASQGGKDPFAAMGLSASTLLAMNPADQFRMIADSIMKIQNPAERNAKAMEIFGKSGAKLMTVFEGLDGAVEALGRMPELAQQFSSAMEEADEIISDKLPMKMDQFFVGFTTGIIGQMLPALRQVNEYDFTDMGENFGRNISDAVQAITDGSMWKTFELQGLIAMEKLKGPSGLEGFAAFANAVFDGITAKYNEGYNFSDSYDKYLNAGLEANAEKIQQLQKELDDIFINAAEKSVSKREAVKGDSSSPAFTPIIPVEIQKTAATQKSLDFQASNFELGQGPRAGLSLNADGGASMAKRSIDYLAKIADILGQAKIQDKQLVWG